MVDQSSSPIFIHSLFRAGSTYLFHVFRRSPSGYWCYQEPLNEKLTYNARQPGGFRVGPKGANEILRHPELDKPHCHEFHVVTEQVLSLYRAGFPYEQYFIQDASELADLIRYFQALMDGAQGRPLFQCCRTAGRVAPLREAFGGHHLFLWRNPWDQWWSYKADPYFESRNLFILGARSLPAFLRHLKQEIGVPDLRQVSEAVRQSYFTHRKLGAAASYRLFYGLWAHMQLTARPWCDVSISIDQLSTSAEYRDRITGELAALGIDGIDFSDCRVPGTVYGESDGRFFLAQEAHVHELLLTNGYSSEEVDRLKAMSEARSRTLLDTALPENAGARDAMRAREQVRRLEERLSEMQLELFNTRGRLQQAEGALQQHSAGVGKRH